MMEPTASVARSKQSLGGKVCVPLRCFKLGVTKELLHLIKTAPGVDEQTGKAVRKIMHADI